MKNSNPTYSTIAIAGLGLALASSTHAAISVFGATSGYQTDDANWLTNTADDIDGNGLGTDGYFFFGNFDGAGGNQNAPNDGNENIFGANQLGAALLTAVQPTYIDTAATVAGTTGFIGSFTHDALDNPLLIGTANEGDDGIGSNLLTTGSGEAVSFTIVGLGANTTVRVGIVNVFNDDDRARFPIPQISLTDGTNTASVAGLDNISAPGEGLGWVFFDIDSDGTYTIVAPGAAPNPVVGGIGGVTFDSFVVPEPSTSFLALFSVAGFLIRRRRS